MEESLFTKIVKGDIPCHKVYEDDKTMAFLDIFPLREGHTLVIPKAQVEFVWDLGDEDYAALMATVKIVASHLRQAMPDEFVASRVVGVDVPHAHVHLIPFSDPMQLKADQDMSGDPDHTSLAALAKTLAF